MPLFALLLLATVFDADVPVPRSRSRGIPVEIPATNGAASFGVIECWFETQAASTLRAVLLRAEDLVRLEQGQEPDILDGAETAAGKGKFRSPVLPAGRYTVIVDNRQGSASVLAHIRVDTHLVTPVELGQSRRRLVTIISLCGFALAAAILGWRLRHVFRAAA